MSRSVKDGRKRGGHGKMSVTRTGVFDEYNSARDPRTAVCAGRYGKTATHRYERREAKQGAAAELAEVVSPPPTDCQCASCRYPHETDHFSVAEWDMLILPYCGLSPEKDRREVYARRPPSDEQLRNLVAVMSRGFR